MASLFSKDKRIIYIRRITKFWDEYKTKKIGMIGLALLIIYIVLAFFAPYLTPYQPLSQPRLAQALAMPEWVTIFPQFSDLPKTQIHSLRWNATTGSQFVKGWDLTNIEVLFGGGTETTVELVSKFSYTQKAPNEFSASIGYDVSNIKDTEYSLTFRVVSPNGTQYMLWRTYATNTTKSESVSIDSKTPKVIKGAGFSATTNIANAIFSEKGEYTASLKINFKPKSQNAKAQVNVGDASLSLWGHVHGLLGTESRGQDIWAQLVYGAQLSLAVGLLAAVVGTSIGIFVGVSSGYLGGAVDEISMRIVDILLCLPLLPLLLVLVQIYGRSVFYIVLFIAIFGWQGLARVIRSQTLSIRETAYIETARASGASGFYIMLRHIVPNIIPVAFASMILAVPSAILFEASLSFLGFGDETVQTWGLMLQHAFGGGGFVHLAWWWIIPPGLAIIGLCLAFVFIGYAFDEIVNPRLRRRR